VFVKSRSNTGSHTPLPLQCKAENNKTERTHSKSPSACWTLAGMGMKVCMQTGDVPCAGFIAEEASTSPRKEASPPKKRCLSEEFHKFCEKHPWF